MGADEPVARELHERFGALIEIEVAGHSYPFDTSLALPPAPTRTSNVADYGIEATTELDAPFNEGIAAGSIITGTVQIHNVSPSRIEWHLGSSMGEGDLCDDSQPPRVLNIRNAHGRGGGGFIALEPEE